MNKNIPSLTSHQFPMLKSMKIIYQCSLQSFQINVSHQQRFKMRQNHHYFPQDPPRTHTYLIQTTTTLSTNLHRPTQTNTNLINLRKMKNLIHTLFTENANDLKVHPCLPQQRNNPPGFQPNEFAFDKLYSIDCIISFFPLLCASSSFLRFFTDFILQLFSDFR